MANELIGSFQKSRGGGDSGYFPLAARSSPTDRQFYSAAASDELELLLFVGASSSLAIKIKVPFLL